MLGLNSLPWVVGVGQDPHSVSLVWRADVPSSQHAPPCVIPQTGKSFDDGAKSTGTQVRAVLREDKSRPDLANDSEHLVPESRTLAGKSFTATRRADVLAGKSTRDNVNCTTPGLPVEGADVIPDRELRQVSISLTGE